MTNAPGKHYRNGISITKLFKMFPDNSTAKKWFESIIWPEGAKCPYCGSMNVQANIKHKSMTHRCRDCPNKPRFSLKTGTVMQSTKLDYQTWAIAIYMVTTNIKGISSMKLHRELDITQKSAWHLAHRLRETFENGSVVFSGPVEVDETYMGGRETNKHDRRKLNAGRGGVGKTAVVGIKDRKTNKIVAKVVPNVRKPTLQNYIKANVSEEAEKFTDNNSAYNGLENRKSVNHSVGEYVRGRIHTNGIESFWAIFKRAHKGTFHKMSPKHLQRYVVEFVGRHNQRPFDTIKQMGKVVDGMTGKRLTYRNLIRENGLDNFAR